MRSPRLLFTMVVAALLAACGQGAPPPTETPTSPPATPSESAPPVMPTEAEQATPPTAPPELTAEGLGPIPQGPSQLRASNPTNVELAAGKPTLVEFFAFW